MTVTDKWSCPRCNATWARDMQWMSEWADNLHRVQSAHEARCAKQAVSLR